MSSGRFAKLNQLLYFGLTLIHFLRRLGGGSRWLKHIPNGVVLMRYRLLLLSDARERVRQRKLSDLLDFAVMFSQETLLLRKT